MDSKPCQALKAHDAWMEDVSQSLQEVHERCEGLAEQISTVEHGLKALQRPVYARSSAFFHAFLSFFELCLTFSVDLRARLPLWKPFEAKLEGKTDIAAWNEMNDDIDQSIRTVRDMASSLRFEAWLGALIWIIYDHLK